MGAEAAAAAAPCTAAAAGTRARYTTAPPPPPPLPLLLTVTPTWRPLLLGTAGLAGVLDAASCCAGGGCGAPDGGPRYCMGTRRLALGCCIASGAVAWLLLLLLLLLWSAWLCCPAASFCASSVGDSGRMAGWRGATAAVGARRRRAGTACARDLRVGWRHGG